jgi:hypothetical protein
VLTTSQPAEQVIAGPETEVNADKTRATTRMREVVQDGVLQRSWCIIPGDPPGTYTYDISIDGEPRGEFVFCAIEVPDQNPNTDPRDLNCPNKFNSVERARPCRARLRDGCRRVRVRPCSASSTAGAIGPDPKDNAILDARTPNYDRLVATCPQGLIDASETFVGLPRGQMGNSEVGHMNLGAGRVAVPDMPRIDKAIEDGSLAKNPILTELIATLKKSGGACHLMGLASPGGVHAHQDHLVALANIIAGAGVPVWIHAFLDGRDTPPRSAQEYLEQIAAGLKKGLPIKFATISGRYYAMDRDKRWDRVEKAYDCLVDARARRPRRRGGRRQGLCRRPGRRVRAADRARRLSGMKDGDGLLMFNYRSDRAREILTALLDPMFDGFKRGRL